MIAPTDARALAVVRALPFFKTVSEQVLRTIADSLLSLSLAEGEVLVRQGEHGDEIFVVESGELRALVTRPDGEQIEVGRILPGHPVGEMQLIGGGVRTATVEATMPSTLFKLPRVVLNRLMHEIPEAFAVATMLTRKRLHHSQLRLALPSVFGPLDHTVLEEIEKKVEWINLAPGQTLFKQGDACDGWYLVLTGTLRVVVRDPNGEERAVRDVSHGESLGEAALITGEPRTATPYAIRDSLVVRFSVQAFEEITDRYPRVLRSITRTLIGQQQRAANPKKKAASRLVIAVVPASPGPAASAFCKTLAASLARIGTTLHIDAARLESYGILDHPSSLPPDHPSWLRFSGWVEDQQSSHAFVLLETDPTPTGWTHRALGQADLVVVVQDATSSKTPTQVEAELLNNAFAMVRRAKRTLVLLHSPDTRLPSGTREWLAPRHVDSHLHVRTDRPEDVDRCARHITGRAVGLTLGGGGARGYAHFGVVNALRELGIPIDVIGGTSMGSIMAGQLALGLNTEELYDLNRRIIAIRPFSEYTVPMVAMLKTTGITRSAKMAFGDTLIEDLWLPYFAVSSNLTTAEMLVHDSGLAWEATRASGSLPGIAIPVVMGKNLLVDGGVVNNLPGDVMRTKCGAGPVIAVNVSPEEDVGIGADEFPSQWSIFWNRVLPGQTRMPVPGIIDILMRTTMLASANRTALVRRSVDLYLRPPIDKFGMLEFERMEELVECGYRYTLETAATWKPDVN